MNPACPQLILFGLDRPVLNGLAFLEADVPLPLAHQQPIVMVMLITSRHFIDLARLQQLLIAGFLTKPLT